jgi:hypothetical protein
MSVIIGGKIHTNHDKLIIHHTVSGGQLEVKQVKDFIKASYEKKQNNIDGFELDNQISDSKSRVYRNPETGQVVVAHRGTSGFTDWFNNLSYAIGGVKGYKNTQRYKDAEKVQLNAQKKYGKDNITTVGHSQGGLQAELLGKDGMETITLNKATRPFSNNKSKNQYDIRTENDIVSSLNPFQKNNGNEITIKSRSKSLLTEHTPNTLSRIGDENYIGIKP